MKLKSKVAYWLRQFPFIVPFKVIPSCEDWINAQRKRSGFYFAQRGPWYKTIFPESFLSQPVPRAVGNPDEKSFAGNGHYPVAKATLFYLQNTYLLGDKGLILTANNYVFDEFSHNFGISTLKNFFRKNFFYTFTTAAKKIQGTGAVLISPESHNYYHWLSDVLPRIRLYDEVLDQVDHFCISANVPPKFLGILNAFGIPENKILLVNDKQKIHFDHLYVSSLPGSEGRSPGWAIDFLREKLIGQLPVLKPLKKIYFKRGGDVKRKLLNEKAIITALQNKGFEIVDPGSLNIREQVALMQQSAIVIGVHGAALANIIFCPDDTTVVELFSPDYFRTDCYYTLSAIRKLNYWYLVGDKPEDAAWGDILINEQLLLNSLTNVIGN